MVSHFRRELTVFSGVALVVSNMIGTVIFTSTGFLASDLGSPFLILALWVLGGLMATAGCLIYSELGINLPRSGGEYVYVREAWGPTWGFMSGWVSFFAGFSAPIAASALAASIYLGSLASSILSNGITETEDKSFATLNLSLIELNFSTYHLVAIFFVALFSLFNIFGLRIAVRLQNILAISKVGMILAFVILGALIGNGNLENFSLSTERTSTHTLPTQFVVSLIVVMFAYSGWNAATYVVEELRTPARTLPKALVTGTLLVTALYLCLNLIYMYAVPLEDVKGVEAVGAVTAKALFGSQIGNLFGAMMALALISTASSMIIAGPRVYRAMAVDGCFFHGAERIHSRWKTPVRSIFYQGIASILMILVSSIESLFYFVGFALIFFSGLAAAGVLRLRKRKGWKGTRALNWLYPAIPLSFVLVSVWMLSYTLLLRPIESTWGLIIISAGGLGRYLWLRTQRT